MPDDNEREALIADLDRKIDACDIWEAWNMMDRAKKFLESER